VEGGSLVAKALGTNSQLSEILGSLWNSLAIKTHYDTAEGLITVGDIEVDLVGDLRAFSCDSCLGEENEDDSEHQQCRHHDTLEVEHLECQLQNLWGFQLIMSRSTRGRQRSWESRG
jgi:hypothetical protein